MLNLIVIISLICTGVFVATRRDMILYPFRAMFLIEAYRTRHSIPKRTNILLLLSYVLFDCLYCESSLWTIICLSVFDYRMLIYAPFMILATCGLNAVFAWIIFGARLNPKR